MHLLWMSDDPQTPSGFGNVTRHVCQGLRARGHRISILSWQAHEPHDWQGCRVHPAGAQSLGKDGLYPFLVRHRPDAVVALADIWWLPYFNAPHIRSHLEMTGTPWILYFPVDGDRDGDLPESWVELLRAVDMPVAMSRYGQAVVERAGVSCDYIPHGVDTQVFRPPKDRERAKAELGLAGRFVVLSDSRNQPRKLLPRLLDVFARFRARRPQAFLHLHTDPDDEFAQTSTYSYDLRADLDRLGLASDVGLTPGLTVQKGGGLPLEELARYYRAADVHLLASSGEGFGLPTLQASAAGAAPMAVAYSANLELIADHGLTIAVADWAHTEFGIRRALLDVDDAAAKLERLADDRAALGRMSRRARAFALGYDWQGVVDSWDRLLRSAALRPRMGGRRPAERTTTLRAIAPEAATAWRDAAIRIKVVERPAGALEAMIRADARYQDTDVAIPTRPPSCRIGRVLVPREAGYVGLAWADRKVFTALKAIFPILHGWIAEPGLAGEEALGEDGVERLAVARPEEARYALACSILVIDTDDRQPAEILIDAAHLGAPCVNGGSGLAGELWPGLVARGPDEAITIARRLLTDPAEHRRCVQSALQSARGRFACDDGAMELWLRRLHSKERHPVSG